MRLLLFQDEVAVALVWIGDLVVFNESLTEFITYNFIDGRAWNGTTDDG